MPVARVRDLEIYYEIHGDGPPVVLISGTGADLRQNPRRSEHPLARGHRTLMYDQRGLGRTSKPDRPATMEDYADDCAALMDELGWDRAHVVGISFGGMVAQHLALRHPDRVDRLVLACTSSGGAGGSSFDLFPLHGLPPEERVAAMLPVMDTRNDPTTDPPTLAPMMQAIATSMLAPDANADDPSAELGKRRQLEARAGHDTWDRLDRITAPTLVAGGRYDGQAPVGNVERLASRIPGATLRFYDGGHVFLLQDRTAWREIIDFLDVAATGEDGDR